MNGVTASVVVLSSILLVIAILDWRQQRIPDILNLLLCLCGLGLSVLTGLQTLLWSVFSAACGFTSLWAVRWGYMHLRGFHGIGLGDVKFFAAAAAWVGVEHLPQVMLVAAVSALLSVPLLKLAGHTWHRDSRLPFGPFLSLGLWLMWLLMTASN